MLVGLTQDGIEYPLLMDGNNSVKSRPLRAGYALVTTEELFLSGASPSELVCSVSRTLGILFKPFIGKRAKCKFQMCLSIYVIGGCVKSKAS